MKNKFFDKSAEETLKALNTDKQSALTQVEAEKRLKEYGENRLEGKKEKTIFQMFLEQFKDFLVIILIVAAVISILLNEVLDGSIIIAIVIINAVLGVTQENKANNALKALKEMSSPQSKIIRDGQIVKINSDQIVPGDIVVLEAGDYVPADVRLVESMNLKIDEAALTGESVPSEKYADKILPSDAGIGDLANSAFMGTVVTYGRGLAVVVNTGMNTEMGNIASMLNETEEGPTHLQKRLDSFGKLLGIACLVVCALVFVLGLILKMDLLEIFMTSVALAVAAIPEGLTVVVTVILTMGMQKMVKRNAIIKKLSAVETLGSTTVICSDKTGTLTQNKMTVVKVFDTQNEFEVSGTGYKKEGEIITQNGEKISENARKLVEGAVLCNDSSYLPAEGKIIGDPTEGALVVLGEKVSMNKDELNKKYPRINEIPFDSDRKLMSTLHEIDGKFTMYTKGAPDEVLARASYIYKNGEIQKITEEDKNKISEANAKYASQALRVLGVAFKIFDTKPDNLDNAEADLIYTGLLCMIDPPREEAKDAIAICKKAGIDVKMITGDHKITATAIGRELGIIDEGHGAVDGKELNLMDDLQLREKVKTTNVFARVSPEHKVRLVTAIRDNGNIAAMTGDGVNDAPSLKRADIGIAMGITGTDVSKEAADMILTDDNFASIVSAVEEGRVIYNNIRKVIGYLISCNVGEILLILFAMILQFVDHNLTVPLVAVQLLAINLITDAFPAFALGMEEKEDGIMNMKPRDPNEQLLDKKMIISVVFQSIALAVGSLASFLFGFYVVGPETASTFCFVTLVFGELLRSYSARSEKRTLFSMKIFSNSFLNKSVLFSLAFLLITVYVPFLHDVFSTTSLSLVNLVIAVIFSVLPVIGGEIAKVVTKDM